MDFIESDGDDAIGRTGPLSLNFSARRFRTKPLSARRAWSSTWATRHQASQHPVLHAARLAQHVVDTFDLDVDP